MRLNKILDKKLKELGFEKISEDIKYACYERKNKEYSFIQRLDFHYKINGNVSVQSYQKGTNSDDFNNVVELTDTELKLAYKKARQIKRRVIYIQKHS